MSYNQRPLESPSYDEKDVTQHVEGNSGNGSLKDAPTPEQIHRMGPEERALALRAAQRMDPGLRTFEKRNLIFFLIALCVCCCSGDNGMWRHTQYDFEAYSDYGRFRWHCYFLG